MRASSFQEQRLAVSSPQVCHLLIYWRFNYASVGPMYGCDIHGPPCVMRIKNFMSLSWAPADMSCQLCWPFKPVMGTSRLLWLQRMILHLQRYSK